MTANTQDKLQPALEGATKGSKSFSKQKPKAKKVKIWQILLIIPFWAELWTLWMLGAVGVQSQKHSPWQQIIQIQGTPQCMDTNRWESRRKAWVSIGPWVKRAGTWNSRYNCRSGRGQSYNEEEEKLQLFAEGWLKLSVAWASSVSLRPAQCMWP